ncbi:MAG TPA: hypothetical protein VIR30_10435 [Nocardioides sp.]
MSDAKKLPRPPQVTLSGWVAIVGSVFVVFDAFEVVGNLRTIDHRERVTETLSQEPFKGMDVSLEQALEFINIAAMVAGASAAAAAILGIFVLQRDKPARIGLSVAAVPLFLAGLVTGGFLSSLVAVCAVMLWTKPSRDWFNGIAAAPVERRTPQKPQNVWGQGGSGQGNEQGDQQSFGPNQVPPGPIAPGDSGDGPRTWSGFGTSSATGQQPDEPVSGAHGGEPGQTLTQPGQQQWEQHQAAQQQWQQQWGQHVSTPVSRPTDVLRACLATWICAGTVAVGALLAGIAMLGSPDLLKEMYEQESRFEDSGLTLEQVKAATIAMAGIFVAWALGAAALAIFVIRGQDWARVLLVISAACAGLLGLLMAFASPFLLLVAAACAYVVYALTRRSASDWFRDQTRLRREGRRR